MMEDKLNGIQMEDISQLLDTIDSLVSLDGNTTGNITKELEVYEAKVSLDDLKNRGFWDTQIHEVKIGLDQRLPVERYAKECFNWMQMREIRLGMLHGVDTDVYDNPLYSAEQMHEIRLGLEYKIDIRQYAQLIYSASDMRRSRLAMMTKVYAENPNGFAREKLDADTGIRIRISSDCMEAFITIPAGTGPKLTYQEVANLLNKCEIEYGVMEDALQKMLDEQIWDQETKIAVGERSKPGRKGWYQLYFQSELPESPKLLDNGRIDYKNVIVAETVEVGQMLAQYHRSQKGKDGKTVTAIDVLAGHGEELPVLLGNGIVRDEATETYFAEYRGYVSFDPVNNELNVRKIYVIQGDANCYNGNIEFDGTVYVRGSVNDMTVIVATGDVVIDGFVARATIRAGGNVILKGGMNGGGTGSVEAGGKVMSKFFESAAVRAKGHIEGNYFLNCNIETDDDIMARGSKAIIMGGRIIAAVGVTSENIGNYGSGRTILDVGNFYWIDVRVKKEQDLLEKAKGEISQLEEGKAKLRQMLGDDVVDGNSIYKKTCMALHTKDLECVRIENEIRRLKNVRKNAERAYVRVTAKLQEGVSITINGNAKEIAADVYGVNLTRGKTRRRGNA